MIRLGLLGLMLLAGLAAGCTTTRKVVIHHGYPGAAPNPPGFEAHKNPGTIVMGTQQEGEAPATSPRIPTNP